MELEKPSQSDVVIKDNRNHVKKMTLHQLALFQLLNPVIQFIKIITSK